MHRAVTVSLFSLVAIAAGCGGDDKPDGGGGNARGVVDAGVVLSGDLSVSPAAVDLAVPGNPPYVPPWPLDMTPTFDFAARKLPAGKLFFTTRSDYPGDLIDQAAGTSGLLAADNICTSSAHAVGIGGTWKAWLSDSQHDWSERIADVGPWYLVDGTLAFQNKANLMTSPNVQLVVDETGRTDAVGRYAWTGVDAKNSSGNFDCMRWGGGPAGLTGTVGNPSLKAGWSGGTALDCSERAHLYCIEQ